MNDTIEWSMVELSYLQRNDEVEIYLTETIHIPR